MKHPGRLLFLVFVFSGAACAHSSLPPRPSSRALEGEEARVVAEMSEAAQQVRGLAFREAVVAREGSPALVEWLVRRDADEQRKAGLLSAHAQTLVAFGFLAPDQDLEEVLVGVLSEQVRGLYDHRDATLLVVPGPSMAATNPTAERLEALGVSEGQLYLLHELVHALQDQHFDLDRLLDVTLEEDASNAARALVEGDATYAMYDYLLRAMTGGHVWDLPSLDAIRTQVRAALLTEENQALATAPLYLREVLLFAYVDGMLFTDAVHRQGGWIALNRAFGDPPRTTEQVLHPEKYLSREPALPVSLPALPDLEDRGWEPVIEGSLGELGLRSFAKTVLGETEAAGAGEGWGGDRYGIWTRDDGPSAAVWAVAFDTPEDAERYEGLLAPRRGGTSSLRLRRLRPDVLGITTHLPEDLAEAVLDRLVEELQAGP